MSNEVERRKHQRVAVRTIVRMRFQSIGDFLQSYAKNISGGGMQLAVAQELAVGDVVGLEFKLKTNYPLIEGTAEVKWCRPYGEHYLVGVSFLDLDERSQKVIAEAVQLRLREQRGIDLNSEIGGDDEIVDVSDTDVLAPPAEDDADFTAAFTFGEADAASSPSGSAFAPPLDADELEVTAEPEIEEMDFDVASVAAAEDAVDIEEVEADFGVAASSDHRVGASIEELQQEMETRAPATDADLFEDTELESGQAEFDFAVETTHAEPQAGGNTAVAHSIESVPRGGGRKRLLAIVAAVLLVGAGAGVAWWLLTANPAPMAEVPAFDPSPPAPPAVVPASPAATVVPATVAAGGANTAAAEVQREPTTPAATQPESRPEPDQPPAPPAEPFAQPAPLKPEPRAVAKVQPEPAPKPVAQLGGKLTQITGFAPGGGNVMLELVGDGSFEGNFKYFALASPPRAVIDIFEVKLGAAVRSIRSDHPHVSKVRVGQHANKVRIVLDLQADRGFTVRADGTRLSVVAE